MKSLLVLVFVCLLTVSHAQECTELVQLRKDNTIEFVTPVRTNARDISMFMTSIALDKVIAVIIILEDKKVCTEKGDSIVLSFGNGTVLTAINDFDPGCEGKFAMYLGEQLGPENALDLLSSNNLVSVRIRLKGMEIIQPVDVPAAHTIRRSLECLSNCLHDETVVESFRKYNENIIFTVVENPAQFPGGHEEMIRFMKKNVTRQPKASGSVFVNFVVERDGSLSDVKVLKGVSPQVDSAAVKAVRAMPNWNQGKQNGKPVRTRYVLPIKF